MVDNCVIQFLFMETHTILLLTFFSDFFKNIALSLWRMDLRNMG